MARLPHVFSIPYQVDVELANAPATRELLNEIRLWAEEMVANQQRYNAALFRDYVQRANPPEMPSYASAQLNTTQPLARPKLGSLVHVADASGGQEIAYGDVSTWRLVRNKASV